MPGCALPRSQRHHLGVHVAPLLAKRVGKVELVLHGNEILGWRSIDLDRLDIRREPFDVET